MNKNKNDQSGFAAIIIAITLVIITSLLVVGFAKLARDEQTQVTNRQLASQAYYAAESGINDAAKALKEGYTDVKDTCGPTPSSSTDGEKYLSNNNIDGTAVGTETPVQWTCLLIDPAPKTLEYSSIGTVTPRVFTFEGRTPSDGEVDAPVNSISFDWQSADPTETDPTNDNGVTNTSFPRQPSWSYMSVLRVTITPLDNYERQSLREGTFTAFLYPSTSTSNRTAIYTPNQSSSGVILNGGCSDDGEPEPGTQRLCSATINNLGNITGRKFLVTMRSIYNPASVSVSINARDHRMGDAQAKVDSTGKSQDVLKRLQVRIPFQNVYKYPGFSVETAGDICKDIEIFPDGGASSCY